MPSILLPRRFTSQPQGGVQVDWSNPLSSGVQVFWLPQSFDPRYATKAIGQRGAGISTNGTDQYQFVPCNWNYSGGVSTLSIADCNWHTKLAFERLVSVRTDTNSTGLQLYTTAGSVKTAQVYCSSTNGNGYKNFTLPSSAQTGPHVFCSTTQYSLASHKFYVDGVELTGTTGGFDNTALYPGASGMDIGRFVWLGTNYFGRYNWIGLGVMWNRVLSASEAIKLSANPYQIFKVAE